MDKTLSLAYQLHDLLLNSDQYNNLKHYEQLMLNDNQSSLLIKNYHNLLEEYNSLKTNELLKKLHEAKLLMDENINVINYKNAYKQYMLLISDITDIVFKDFTQKTTLDKILKVI